MRFYEKKRGRGGKYGENTGGIGGYTGLMANRLRIGKELGANRLAGDSKPLFGQNTDKKFRSLSHAFLLHPQNQSVHIHLRVVKTV